MKVLVFILRDAVDRINKYYSKRVKFIVQQVQVLLKECEEARGGVVSSEERVQPMSSTEVTSSSQVISKHLVTFRRVH